MFKTMPVLSSKLLQFTFLLYFLSIVFVRSGTVYLTSNRQYLSDDDCLEDKRKEYQNGYFAPCEGCKV